MNIIFDGYIWQWLNTSNFQVQNVCIFRQTTRKITNRRPLWHLPIGCYRRWPIPHPPSNISSQYQNLTVYRLQWLYLPLTTMKHYSLWYWTPQLRGLVSNSGSARQSWTLRWPLQQHVCLSNCIGGGGSNLHLNWMSPWWGFKRCWKVWYVRSSVLSLLMPVWNILSLPNRSATKKCKCK